MYSIKNRVDLENKNELVILGSQVKALSLLDKIVKQNFHEDIKKVFEPVTKCNKDVSEEVTKCTMLTSQENNKTI